jgi:hypothetical protein
VHQRQLSNPDISLSPSLTLALTLTLTLSLTLTLALTLDLTYQVCHRKLRADAVPLWHGGRPRGSGEQGGVRSLLPWLLVLRRHGHRTLPLTRT